MRTRGSEFIRRFLAHGAKAMGLVGLFVGPVLMALLFATWREWLNTVDEDAAAEEIANPS